MKKQTNLKIRIPLQASSGQCCDAFAPPEENLKGALVI